jgi:integrase
MDITFEQIAERYLEERVVTPSYRNNVRRIAKLVKRPTVEAVNKFLRRRSEERSSVTVRSERVVLVSLWRWAYEARLLDDAPRGVIRIKARRAPTKAWTVEQLRAAIEATRKYDRKLLLSGASKGLTLRAWLLLGYEAGSRFGDLFALRGDQIDRETISWTQSKTGDPIVRTLSAACLEACREMLAHSKDGTILGWAVGKRQSMRLMREFLDEVGIGGTSKWLRRSGATHIEMAEPGKARHHLGHRTMDLAAKAYIDWTQVRRNAPRTPELIHGGNHGGEFPS